MKLGPRVLVIAVEYVNGLKTGVRLTLACGHVIAGYRAVIPKTAHCRYCRQPSDKPSDGGFILPAALLGLVVLCLIVLAERCSTS